MYIIYYVYVYIYIYVYVCIYIIYYYTILSYIILHDVIYLIPSPGAGTHPSKQNWHIRQDVFVYIICQEAAELPKIRCVISHGLMWIKDLKGEAWGYDSWLVQTWFLFSISYMGCHPKPIDFHSIIFQDGYVAPATS